MTHRPPPSTSSASVLATSLVSLLLVVGCSTVAQREGDLLASGYLFLPEEGRPHLSQPDEVLIPESGRLIARLAHDWVPERFGQVYPGGYAFIEADPTGEAKREANARISHEFDSVAAFWEIESDGEGGGRFRFLYLVRGGPPHFVFLADLERWSASGERDSEAGDGEKTGGKGFHISATAVVRDDLLEEAARLGSTALLRDYRGDEPGIVGLPTDVPPVPGELLRESRPDGACRSFAAGVATRIAADLPLLLGEARRTDIYPHVAPNEPDRSKEGR